MIRKGSSGARPRRSRMTPWAALLVISLVLVPGAAGCSAEHGTSATVTPAVGRGATHTMPNGTTMTAEEMDANWAARPAYVRQNQHTQNAYAYAMDAWNVIQWMPCYCGCGAMGHTSNLDCYYKPMLPGSNGLTYEEHASYCQICVDITTTASKLAGEGKSLLEIRQAVDRQYGNAGPGTDTALPAS